MSGRKKKRADFGETLAAIFHRQFIEKSTYVQVHTQIEYETLSNAGWETVEKTDSAWLMRKDLTPTQGDANTPKGIN